MVILNVIAKKSNEVQVGEFFISKKMLFKIMWHKVSAQKHKLKAKMRYKFRENIKNMCYFFADS